MVQSHESLPWRRRNFERKGVIEQLLLSAGFSLQWKEQGGEHEGDEEELTQNPQQPGGSGGGDTRATGRALLATVPKEVPEGPTLELKRQELFEAVQSTVLADLSSSGGEAAMDAHAMATPRIALCGLGGAGKTTLAARLVRDPCVRRAFDKVCWITLGHAPDFPFLRLSLFKQLAGGSAAPPKDAATANDPNVMLEAGMFLTYGYGDLSVRVRIPPYGYPYPYELPALGVLTAGHS